jgi:hypothetical protein
MMAARRSRDVNFRFTVALRATATEEGSFFPLFCSRSTKANGMLTRVDLAGLGLL